MKIAPKLTIQTLETPESVPFQADQVFLQRLPIILARVIQHWLKTANFSYSLCRGLGLGTTRGAPDGRGGASDRRGE